MTYTRDEMLTSRTVERPRYKQAWLKPIHPMMAPDPHAPNPTFRYSNRLNLDLTIRVLALIVAESAKDLDGNPQTYTGEWLAHLWTYAAQTDDANALLEEILLLEPPHRTVRIGTLLSYETAGLIQWKAWLHRLHVDPDATTIPPTSPILTT
jgi:hypothetical protein